MGPVNGIGDRIRIENHLQSREILLGIALLIPFDRALEYEAGGRGYAFFAGLREDAAFLAATFLRFFRAFRRFRFIVTLCCCPIVVRGVSSPRSCVKRGDGATECGSYGKMVGGLLDLDTSDVQNMCRPIAHFCTFLHIYVHANELRLCGEKWRKSRNENMLQMEARTGIEPVYEVLQTSA